MQQRGAGPASVDFIARPGRKEGVNISEKLDRRENAVRFLLLDELVRTRQPLEPAQIERACGRLSLAVGDIIRQLDEKGAIVRDDNKAVTAVYPVSATPTRHRVLLADGRTFHAMCAIDAIGTVFTFNQDTTVESTCLHCETAVRLRLANGRLLAAEPRTVHVLHADLARYRNWAADC